MFGEQLCIVIISRMVAEVMCLMCTKLDVVSSGSQRLHINRV